MYIESNNLHYWLLRAFTPCKFKIVNKNNDLMFLLRMHTRAVNIANKRAHFHFKEMDLNDKKIENIKVYRPFFKMDLGGNRARIIISC